MDDSESLVDRYLRFRGFNTVIYEPDGNVPPDFLADHRIAVEVRRLNQNFVHDCGERRGLEELSIPLRRKVKTLLPCLGPAIDGETWFVAFDFRRPLESWNSLELKIAAALTRFRTSPVRSRVTLPITDNFEVELFPASRAHATTFVLGAASDDDAGGFVLAEVVRNLQLCSEEKEGKVKRFRAKYPEWWLVLPDHVGYGVDPQDEAAYRDALTFSHGWDKIVLLDPRDHRRAFEI